MENFSLEINISGELIVSFISYISRISISCQFPSKSQTNLIGFEWGEGWKTPRHPTVPGSEVVRLTKPTLSTNNYIYVECHIVCKPANPGQGEIIIG